MKNLFPIAQDLVLVGGGHSHVIALRMLAMNPLLGVRLTLITDTSHTPYSGMLPGHVAGFYSYDETHIDLRRLAEFAGAHLYIDEAVGLDVESKQVICANHPPVSFDYLSIDIGSTPQAIKVPGAQKWATPAKPVPQFLASWNRLCAEVSNSPEQAISLAIVGGGAGGVELALNMQRHLHDLLKQSQQDVNNLTIHLFHRGQELLSHHNSWVSKRLEKILIKRGIQLHLQEDVVEITATSGNYKRVICQSGLKKECNFMFWVTNAAAPDWIKESGLSTDSKGFVLVKDTLQSLSHPNIFAAGDIATMQNYSRPKAGVFAVRQGKPLAENLRHILLGETLDLYVPQKRYLALIGTGDKQAIASWWRLGWQSAWLWQRKDHIDRKFMNLFADLPSMATETQADNPPLMPCAGCGSKVGSRVLDSVLKKLQITENENIIIGINNPDDAAIVKVPKGKLIVHTVDYFPSLINDPFVFGQIATNHCLSDIFAMGATPQTALAIVTIPYGIEEKVAETLYQLLSGANKILQQSKTSLVGGHTIEGKELSFGLSCNGLIEPDQLLKKSNLQPGQILILTKAIGTGTLFAANMRYQAKGRWIEKAVESMLISNQKAAEIFLKYGATACTDITGFGLLGHLIEMVKASQINLELDLKKIPILLGAIPTIKKGLTSSLQAQNLRAATYIQNVSEVSHQPEYQLLFDPQTSGGLLATLPPEKAEFCLRELQQQGYKDSSLIGIVLPYKSQVTPVLIC